jgi:hypothetical protein
MVRVAVSGPVGRCVLVDEVIAVGMGARSIVVRVVVVVAAGIDVHRNQIQTTMPHLRLGSEGVGEGLNGRRGPAQHHGLQAVLVVQVHVHGRQHEVVVVVLQAGQALSQIAGVVVVDVAEGSHAERRLLALQALRTEEVAEQVAHRFRAVAIALSADVFVELTRQFLAERNGEPFHAFPRTDASHRRSAFLVLATFCA